jgi:protein-disulfide isomerase
MLRKTHEFTPWMIIFVLCSSVCLLPARAQSNADPPSRQEVVEYVRELLAFPKAVQLDAGSISDLPFAKFYNATVTANTPPSTKTKTLNVLLSKDREFFVVGQLYEVNADFQTSAIPQVRNILEVPPDMDISIGAPSPSLYSAFYKVPVVLRNATRELSTDIYLTTDRRTLVVGLLFPIRALPRPEILKSISLTNTPSEGPNDAPITIVEFADLQCSACARMHEFLENALMSRYKNEIRISFKEFPVIAIHNWAWTAALASKCVYEIRPEAFLRYRSLVFQEQSTIKAANANRALLDAGRTVGVDEEKLSACIESPRPKSLVEQDTREGKLLEISTTPTLVVNGRILVGMPDESYFYKVLDAALTHKQTETVFSPKAGCNVGGEQPSAPCVVPRE